MSTENRSSNKDRLFPLSKRELVIAALLLIVFLAVAIPFGHYAVFDGNYTLTIDVDAGNSVDIGSLEFATCWTDEKAEETVRTGLALGEPFVMGDSAGKQRFAISVPYSGRLNAFDQITSYHEPTYLVVQFACKGDPPKIERKQFSIPTGRGNREIRISLP